MELFAEETEVRMLVLVPLFPKISAEEENNL